MSQVISYHNEHFYSDSLIVSLYDLSCFKTLPVCLTTDSKILESLRIGSVGWYKMPPAHHWIYRQCEVYLSNSIVPKHEILENISKPYGLVSVPFPFYSIRNMFLSKHVPLFSNILLSLRLSF